MPLFHGECYFFALLCFVRQQHDLHRPAGAKGSKGLLVGRQGEGVGDQGLYPEPAGGYQVDGGLVELDVIIGAAEGDLPVVDLGRGDGDIQVRRADPEQNDPPAPADLPD